MSEHQMMLGLEGPLESPRRTVSLRSGTARFHHSNGDGRQESYSSETPAGIMERLALLETELQRHLDRFRGLGAEVTIQAMVRTRFTENAVRPHQDFAGFWGSLRLPDAWPAMFGYNGSNFPAFRRGPWEQWNAASLEHLELDSGLPMVFSPYCATLFHETVGHAMEAEYLPHSPLQGAMGKQVGCSALEIMDRPDLHGYAGSMTSDDSGRIATETSLVYRGFLVGDLGLANGVWRRGSYRDMPQIRATNFMIGAGSEDPQNWLESLEICTYVSWIQSGNWKPGSNRVKVLTGPVFLLRRGEPVAWKEWAVLELSNKSMLSGIEAVGNDLCMDPVVHWCVKKNQSVPIGMGSPSLLFRGDAS